MKITITILNHLLMILGMSVYTLAMNGQTISTFENIGLKQNTYWAGSVTGADTTLTSGNGEFANYYNTTYAYWSGGWAMSTMTDSTTAGYTNLYSARTGSGFNSATYAVGTMGSSIGLTNVAKGGIVNGVYVTNGTYAALSMKHGDAFAKRFGDTTGTHCHCPQNTYGDWFKLTIRNWFNGKLGQDSVEFYLADYRFGNDTAKDYIVNKWSWVDLTSLGNSDSLVFNLSSSDNSAYGMNTPAYFCIDNFTTADHTTGIAQIHLTNLNKISIYPNPATDHLTLIGAGIDNELVDISVWDITGRVLFSNKWLQSEPLTIELNALNAGVYGITVQSGKEKISDRFIKE